ncbi:BTB/POZ domain-containing protein 6 isoform X3 [Ischnura elegans]|uniref:BTB/POZ domain-containing protein 6 isoform X3 n=1 Tax=Ischnura elegans TaxID=197161 RepID=UPI001ED8996E|nr:BTB/POZ domain-containing protein 6 isoform X3 [Ischnura elegans]XP_046402329.1 BTB/POZ domain-containing protein 6 isoform X3 [Ischnura elegans]
MGERRGDRSGAREDPHGDTRRANVAWQQGRCVDLLARVHGPLDRSVEQAEALLLLADGQYHTNGGEERRRNAFRQNRQAADGGGGVGASEAEEGGNVVTARQGSRSPVESLNNGGLSLSPPPTISQRESMQITQPASAPTSPLASPNSVTTSFNLSSPGQSTLDINWQASKPTVRERNAAMFNNELMSDIRFIVGSPGHTQTIPAHKYVLATGSSVFYAMFFGSLAENKQEIEVPDVEPSAFLTLLKYLYCDEIQLEADTVLATLYVAKKYIVPHLAKACVNYLETSLTAKNACLLLSQSRLFEEPELMQRCWEVIDAQAEMALRSEGFVDIDSHTLECVLSRETLNCKETHLFEAALGWAAAECARRDVEPTPQNKRTALGRALYLVRIPTMSLEDFANCAAQVGILTHKETIDIFLHFTAHVKPTLNYPTKPRTGLKPQICHRFQSCAYRSNQWRYRGRCDSIQFSVDKRIFVVGFGLYGSSSGAADYNVRIELKRLGRILAENDTKFFSDGSSNTFHVYFEHPIQIEPESFYTASAVLDGGELSYFGQEGMSEVSVGCVTFQFQCSSESTNGTGVQGGQIPELIFYGPSPTATEEQ